MTELSVLIPTIDGREAMLATVTATVKRQYPAAEILVARGGSWGAGLNFLAQYAAGSYWSCCCDDTVPIDGWFDAGRAMLEQGCEPASRYFTVDGEPLHLSDAAPHGEPLNWCRSFLLTPEMYEQVGPFIDASWYVDFDYSERLIAAGWPIRACDGFAFTHLAGSQEWNTPAEDARGRALYEQSRRQRGLPV